MRICGCPVLQAVGLPVTAQMLLLIFLQVINTFLRLNTDVVLFQISLQDVFVLMYMPVHLFLKAQPILFSAVLLLLPKTVQLSQREKDLQEKAF